MPTELTTNMAGVRFPNEDKSSRVFIVALCAPGDKLELRPEPRNKHDPRAVAEWSPDGQLGYRLSPDLTCYHLLGPPRRDRFRLRIA